MNYTYEAYHGNGVRVQGALEAQSFAMAREKLKAEGLVTISISEERTSSRVGMYLRRRKLCLSDLEFFCSQMSMLLKNGVRVDKALDLLRHGAVKDRRLKEMLQSLHDTVRRGIPLSEALAEELVEFDPIYMRVVAIGEKTGNLAEAFGDLERTLKFRKEIASRVKSSLAYPLIIFAFSILALTFIFDFIIPKFGILFDSGQALPFYTRMLLDFSEFFQSFQYVLFGAVPVLWIFLARASKIQALKKMTDYLLYKLPGVNSVVLSLENLRFASALRVLLKNNILIDEALGHATMAVSNSYFRKRIASLPSEIKKGRQLSDLLAMSRFIPMSYISLVEIGQHAGNLDEIFGEIEERFRFRFEEVMVRSTAFLEPLMIVVMGLIVGSIVVTLMMSILALQDIKF